jgi:uncharacterized membrane protein YfcA
VAFGTSLAAATFLAIPGTATHAALWHIDWTIAAVLAATSVPLASLGAHTTLRIRTERLGRGDGGFPAVALLLLLLANR